MRKVLLAILLLGLVLAVSYIKTRRDEDKRQAAVAQSRQQLDHELGELASSVDSLKQTVGVTRTVYEDSIEQLNSAHDQEADSLKQLVLDYEAKTDSIAIPAEIGLTDSARLESTEVVVKADSSDLHRRILSYYQKRYSDLPKDLSSYEKRVALSEIREETARQFSISVAQLNRMRKQNNLSF